MRKSYMLLVVVASVCAGVLMGCSGGADASSNAPVSSTAPIAPKGGAGGGMGSMAKAPAPTPGPGAGK